MWKQVLIGLLVVISVLAVMNSAITGDVVKKIANEQSQIEDSIQIMPMYTNDTSGWCYCDNCTDCQAALNDNENCTVGVILTQNITNHTGTCIDNPANFSNKIFDCQGFLIEGDNTGTNSGIYLLEQENNTIQNCDIRGFSYGVLIDSSQYNNFTNNSMNYNDYGIYFYSSSNNTFENNSLNYNHLRGLLINGLSLYNRFINNTASGNFEYGIYLSSNSTNNYFEKTTACANFIDDVNDLDENTFNETKCDKASTGSICVYNCICECDSCSSCTAALNSSSCADIRLNQSITAIGTCIDKPRNFNFKIFDCQWNSITGDSTGTGINLFMNYVNSITNCSISNFSYASYIDLSFLIFILNNSVENNANGILFTNNSLFSVILYNNFKNNSEYDIIISNDTILTFVMINTFNSSDVGVLVDNTFGTVVMNNTFYDTISTAIKSYDSNYTIVAYTDVYGSIGDGIVFDIGENNSLGGIVVTDVGGNALVFNNQNDLWITNISAKNSTGAGIVLNNTVLNTYSFFSEYQDYISNYIGEFNLNEINFDELPEEISVLAENEEMFNNQKDILFREVLDGDFLNYGEDSMNTLASETEYAIEQLFYIENNTYGMIITDCSGLIDIINCNVTNNKVGIWANTSALNVHYNNLWNNANFSIQNANSSMNINAASNWWNTTTTPSNGTTPPKNVSLNVTVGDWLKAPVIIDKPLYISSPINGSNQNANIKLNVFTNRNSTCTWGVGANMSKTGGTNHTQDDVASNGTRTYNFNCKRIGTSETFSDSVTVYVDTITPEVTSISISSLTDTEAVISWNTSENTTSRIYYGTTTSFSNYVNDTNFFAKHEKQITGLSGSTKYYFKISSWDKVNNSANSTVYYFITENRTVFNIESSNNTTITILKPNVTVYMQANNSQIGNIFYISEMQLNPATQIPIPGVVFYNITVDNSLYDVLKWAQINMSYNQTLVSSAGINESNLVLYKHNGSSWILVSNTGVNTNANYVYANVTGFSYFAIAGKLNNGVSCTSDSECNSNACLEDYDGEGAWCGPSTNCAHNGAVNTSTGTYLCDGNYSLKCNNGDWIRSTCSLGCNASTGLCISSDDDDSGSGGGSGGAIVTTGLVSEWNGSSYKKSLVVNDIISFSHNTEQHFIKLVSLGTTYAVLQINSTPINVTVNLNETKEVDIDEDNVSDISIFLEKIEFGRAYFVFNQIEIQQEFVNLEDTIVQPPLSISPFCGDNVCDGTETCLTCPSDCGICTDEEIKSGNLPVTMLIIIVVISCVAAGIIVVVYVKFFNKEQAVVIPSQSAPYAAPVMKPTIQYPAVPGTKPESPPEQEHKLEGYVGRMLAKGVPEASIASVLRKVGWNELTVRKVMVLGKIPIEAVEKAKTYVTASLNKGVSREVIRYRLATKGWPEHVIDKLF